ncbi:hypothetical protein TNCT_145911 [Trichonephila clavata]|uniref:Uncharacterized protein n=1 Tax=Trichonephila clavata TaxID=2740835 RepID=A0A8X6KY79_TRICU|nr:hypothetical protein TNCT_145911 [Trichonephila clavata]
MSEEVGMKPLGDLCSIGAPSFLVQYLHENPAESFAEVSMEEEVGERQRLTVAEIGQKLFQMAETFEQTRHTERQEKKSRISHLWRWWKNS